MTWEGWECDIHPWDDVLDGSDDGRDGGMDISDQDRQASTEPDGGQGQRWTGKHWSQT